MSNLSVTVTRILSIWFAIAATFLVQHAQADITLGAPSPATTDPCDDFFTKELNNPVDMSDTADVNNFFKDQDIQGFTGTSISGGVFNGTAASGATSLFYLWSPFVCGSYPIGGRFGAKTSLGYDHVINMTSTLASKYTRLSARVYHPAVTAGSGASVRARFDRDCSYGNKISITSANGLKEGWRTYTFDLTQTPAAGDTTPWTNGDITGLAIEPTQQGGAAVKVDWVRLEDPNSCNNANITVPFSATTTSNNDLMRFFVDDDTTPMNGYVKALSTLPQSASGAGNLTISDLTGVPPGQYYINAIQDSDIATLWAANPWDFSSNDDVQATGDIRDLTYTGSTVTGTTTTTDANIFLALPGSIPAATYDQLSIRITGTNIGAPSSPVRLLWNDGFKDLRTTDTEYQGDGVWHVDLSGTAAWTGTITTFIVRPSISSEQTFSLDFVSLRSSGFDTTRTTSSPQTFATSQRLRVNAPPVGQITKPDHNSGEALKQWNMNSGDFVLLTNMQSGVDPANPTENYCSFLPDVRRVDGIRGDFFKGANEAGNGDANPHSVFPLYTDNPITFAPSEYKHLCYKMLIDREFSLRDGHHARVLWENATTSYTSEDLVAIFDRWSGSRWYEYCMDFSKVPVDGQTSNPGWNGTVQKFRVDPHEWSHTFLNDDLSIPAGASPLSVPFYFDYIKLRKSATAKKRHVLVYSATDPDDATPQVTFFTNSSKSTTGGTAIPTGNLSCTGRVCVWDTTHLSNGTYYVYASISDTRATNLFSALVPVVVDNTSDSSLAAPVLSLEAPSDNTTICNDLQVKGYAIQTETGANTPVQTVQVLVDGQFFALIDPIEYSGAAKTAYPNSDSSNTGFNRLLDASSLSSGTHTVTVTAFGAHGASTVRSFTITKQTSSCPTPVTDAEPAGSPVSTIVGIPPGAGISLALSVTSSGNNLLYDISGIDNKCAQVRLKIAESNDKLTNGPFTFIQTNTDRSTFTGGTLAYMSEDIPRLSLSTTPSTPLCKGNKTYAKCVKKCPAIKKGLKGAALKKAKQKRASCLAKCETKSNCVVKQPTATPTGDSTASIQADCGDGTGTSSTVEVDATTVGNAGRTTTTITQWVDALRLSGKTR